MSVKASVQRMEGSKVSLEVEVPPEDVRRGLEEAYRRLSQKVRVPGFRPGRVPPEVLRARLGRQSVYDEALEVILPKAYREAVEESALEPVEDPRFDIVQMDEERPLLFKAEVTVKPEVKLGTYRGVKAERVVRRVSEQDVERVLRRLQERYAVLEDRDDPVRGGHFVELDYDALLEGKPFRGGAARGRVVEVGAGQVLPGFDAAIEGMRPGDRREIELAVPDDHPDKTLAGKRLTFHVTVHSVKVKRLPEIDDELARDAGSYDSLEQLKQSVREELQHSADRRSTEELRRQVVEKAAQGVSVELPEPMVRRRTDRLIRELTERLATQGVTIERYLELTGRSASELVTSMEPAARRQLTEELVLDAVSHAEGLAVDADELNRRLDELVAAYAPEAGRGGRARQETKRREQLREELREGLTTAMLREKAVDFLVEHAYVTERAVEGIEDETVAEPAATGTERPAGVGQSA